MTDGGPSGERRSKKLRERIMQKLPQNWFHKITLGDKNNESEHNDDNYDQIMTIINMITMMSDNYIKFISREYITIFGMPIIWRYNILWVSMMTMIFGHKIPQKLFCKNTSEDKETQKLEMGGCRRDSLPCASKLKPIFSPDFTLPVLHREETFTFSYHFQNRAQLTAWFILNSVNPESQIYSLIPTADLSISYLWS